MQTNLLENQERRMANNCSKVTVGCSTRTSLLYHGSLLKKNSQIPRSLQRRAVLIHHFPNKDRSMVMLILFLCPTCHLLTHYCLSSIPLQHPRSSPPFLHCTQHDVSCNHRWTQFQGQFEDYLLSLVNKKNRRQAFCGCSFETYWQVYKWFTVAVITINVKSLCDI